MGVRVSSVLYHLEVSSAHLVEDPARVVLAVRQRLEGGDGILALVLAEQAVAVGELPQEPQCPRRAWLG